MRFAFAMKDQKNRRASFKLSKPIGRIDRAGDHRSEPDLRAAGVNTDAIRQSVTKGLNCSLLPCRRASKRSAIRVFGSLAEHVTDRKKTVAGSCFSGR